ENCRTAACIGQGIIPSDRDNQIEEPLTPTGGLGFISFKNQLVVKGTVWIFHPAVVFGLGQKGEIETAWFITKNRRIVKAITQRIATAGCFSITFALQVRLHQPIAAYRAFDSPLVNSKQADMRVLLVLAGTNDNCRLFKRSDQKWILTHDLSLVLTSDNGLGGRNCRRVGENGNIARAAKEWQWTTRMEGTTLRRVDRRGSLASHAVLADSWSQKIRYRSDQWLSASTVPVANSPSAHPERPDLL